MTDYKMVFAGFGGQGILFAGKVAANAGLHDGKEVSWLPSYGPEMRGGTANCSVCISEEPIGSPLVVRPNILVAMNQPSYEKFIDKVAPGGLVVYDSTLIHADAPRGDLTIIAVPATAMAEEQDLKGLANIIILGKVLEQTGFATMEGIKGGVEHAVPPKKQHLIAANLRAIELGQAFEA